MAADAATPLPPPFPRGHAMLLAVGLAGSLLVNLSGQLVAFNLADIQRGISASANEASWLTTIYTMALLCGVVCAPALIAAAGPRRFTAAAALTFSATALACAATSSLPLLLPLRALQGFAAGGFGPVAFVATFVTMRGPRLPLGLAVLALILLLPATFGPAASALQEEALGWQSLFVVQALVGGALAAAALLLMPRSPLMPEALHRDWTSVLLLCAALAASALVLGQGGRLHWLDSDLIGWSIALAAGAWAGFVLSLSRSPMPILSVPLIASRGFGLPIALNFIFRAGFATTAFLVPQFLMVIGGYRPLELASLFLWAGIPQLLAFPLAWSLLQRLDGRVVAAAGLLLFAAGAILASASTGISAATQFRIPMALMGAGQVLFLVPVLIAGGRSVAPADAPTATVLFNGTTTMGTAVGVAAAAELVAKREMFHLGAVFGREASVLSFNEAFLLAGLLLAAAAGGLLLFLRQPPLRAAASA